MSGYIVSARKYRPVRFDEVVGQSQVTETLKNAVKTGKVAHAYLFCGPRGVGKTTTARILAKILNCLNPGTDFEPCNVCTSCQAFNESNSFNIHELDAASNNSVNDVRQLIEQVRILPQIGKYSIYIIDEVHMLTQQAFNAFLKTLEEPPHHAIFILATTEKHKILPTVLSRCQVFDFARISTEDISKQLAQIAQKEGISYEEDVLLYIAKKADGGLRDALSIFDRLVNFCGNHLRREDVFQNLYILDYELFFKITDNALNEDHKSLLLIYDKILASGFDGQHFIQGLSDHFRSLLVAREPSTLHLIDTSESIRQAYQDQSKRCDPDFLFQALEILNRADLDYPSSTAKRFFVEVMLLQLARLKKKSLADSIEISGKIPESELTSSINTSSHSIISKDDKKIPTFHYITISPEKVQPALDLNSDNKASESPNLSDSQASQKLETISDTIQDKPTQVREIVLDLNDIVKTTLERISAIPEKKTLLTLLGSLRISWKDNVLIFTCKNKSEQSILQENLDTLTKELILTEPKICQMTHQVILDENFTQPKSPKPTKPSEIKKAMIQKNPDIEHFIQNLSLDSDF